MANYIMGTLSSPLGTSPFDVAIAKRDRVVSGFVAKLNPTDAKVLALKAKVFAVTASVYPGIGDFGPGGGPLNR